MHLFGRFVIMYKIDVIMGKLSTECLPVFDGVSILDLGCGTGLELDFIFPRFPSVEVTGIDLTEEMLIRLQQKHSDKSIRLICGDYFKLELGDCAYDCAISFQSLHHFRHEMKLSVYKKIYKALKEDGIYIECDYMVETQAEEDLWFSESERIRKEQGICDGGFYHYDTPCTIDNQISLLKKGGFTDVSQAFRIENTTILVARK